MKNPGPPFAVMIAVFALAPPAHAQTAPTDFCVGGQIAVMRLSTLVEVSARAGFDRCKTLRCVTRRADSG